MTRSVTLVCGPPCSGKSTHVARHAQPGDLIVCFDQYATYTPSPADTVTETGMWLHAADP